MAHLLAPGDEPRDKDKHDGGGIGRERGNIYLEISIYLSL